MIAERWAPIMGDLPGNNQFVGVSAGRYHPLCALGELDHRETIIREGLC